MPEVKRDSFAWLVGQRILALRTELNLNQEQLAHEMGTTAVNVSRWENGIHEISLSTLWNLANIKNKPMSYFLPKQSATDNQAEILESYDALDQTGKDLMRNLLIRLSEAKLATQRRASA